MSLRFVSAIRPVRLLYSARLMSTGEQGSGAGKGGGTGGAVRDAGGAFGKRQAAKEEEYFRNLSQSQFAALKTSIEDEIKYHEKEIKEHRDDLERHQKKLDELKKITESK